VSEKIRIAEVRNCSEYSCPHRKDYRDNDTGGLATICWKAGRVVLFDDFGTNHIDLFPTWCPLEVREKV